MGYQPVYPQITDTLAYKNKRLRAKEVKDPYLPVSDKDRLLSLREVAAITRCKLWTVRDISRLNLHQTIVNGKIHLWLSQALLFDFPQTLTDADAKAMVEMPRGRRKRAILAARQYRSITGKRIPYRLMRLSKRHPQAIIAKREYLKTGRVLPLDINLRYKTLASLDREAKRMMDYLNQGL